MACSKLQLLVYAGWRRDIQQVESHFIDALLEFLQPVHVTLVYIVPTVYTLVGGTRCIYSNY